VCGTWSLSLFLSTVSTGGASNIFTIAQSGAQGSGKIFEQGFVVHAVPVPDVARASFAKPLR